MGGRFESILGRLRFRRMLTRWQRLADTVEATSPAELRALRGEARQLRREIDRLILAADSQLATPASGGEALRRAKFADWAWRPELWRRPVSPGGAIIAAGGATLGRETQLFHDGTACEAALRQVRAPREAGNAPFGLCLEVFHFNGSFISLVVDLPEAAVRGLTLNHVIRLDLVIRAERPVAGFARFNVRHGPNSEQVNRAIARGSEELMLEFDLAYTKMNERRVERAWLDLILEGTAMNRIFIEDLTMSRRHRATL